MLGQHTFQNIRKIFFFLENIRNLLEYNFFILQLGLESGPGSPSIQY